METDLLRHPVAHQRSSARTANQDGVTVRFESEAV